MANSLKSTDLLNTFSGLDPYPVEREQRITVKRADLYALNDTVNALLMYEDTESAISLNDIIKKLDVVVDEDNDNIIKHNIKLVDLENETHVINITPGLDLTKSAEISYDIKDYAEQGRGFGKIKQTIQITGVNNDTPLVQDNVSVKIADTDNLHLAIDLTKENPTDAEPTYLGAKNINIDVEVLSSANFELTSSDYTFSTPDGYVGTKVLTVSPTLSSLEIDSLPTYDSSNEDEESYKIYTPKESAIGFNTVTIPKINESCNIIASLVPASGEAATNNLYINSTTEGTDTVSKEISLILIGTVLEKIRGIFSKLPTNELTPSPDTFTLYNLNDEEIEGSISANVGDTVKVIYRYETEVPVEGDETATTIEIMEDMPRYYYFNGLVWTEISGFSLSEPNSAIVTLADQPAGVIFSITDRETLEYDGTSDRLAGYKKVLIKEPGSYKYLYTQPQNLLDYSSSTDNEGQVNSNIPYLTFNFNDKLKAVNTIVIPKIKSSMKLITSSELEEAFSTGKNLLTVYPSYEEVNIDYTDNEEPASAKVQVPNVFNGITIELPNVVLATESSQDLALFKTISKNVISSNNIQAEMSINTALTGETTKQGESIKTDSIVKSDDQGLYTCTNSSVQLINKTKSNVYTLVVERDTACLVNIYQLDKTDAELYSEASKLFSFNYLGKQFKKDTATFINPDKYIISFVDNFSIKNTTEIDDAGNETTKLQVNNIDVSIISGETGETQVLTPEEIAELFNLSATIELSENISFLAVEYINNLTTNIFEASYENTTIALPATYAAVEQADTNSKGFTRDSLQGAIIWIDSSNGWGYAPNGRIINTSDQETYIVNNDYYMPSQSAEFTYVTDAWWKQTVENNEYINLSDELEYYERFFNIYRGIDASNIKDHFKIYIPTLESGDITMSDANGEEHAYISMPLNFINGYYDIASDSIILDQSITEATISTNNTEIVLDTLTVNNIKYNINKLNTGDSSTETYFYSYESYEEEDNPVAESIINTITFSGNQVTVNLPDGNVVTAYYELIGEHFMLYFNQSSPAFMLSYDNGQLILTYLETDYTLIKDNLEGIYQTVAYDNISFQYSELVKQDQVITVQIESDIDSTIKIETVEADKIKTFIYNDLIYTVQEFAEATGTYTANAVLEVTNIKVANNKIYLNPLSILSTEVNN
jgi:hypothetical protein